MKIQAKNQNDQTDASKCGKPLLKNQNKPKGRKFGKNITLEASNKGKKNPIKTSVNEKTETCTKQIQQYQQEIIAYIIKQEKEEQFFMIDHNYVKKSTNISTKLRNFLVKYIFKIVKTYQLKKRTLFLAIFYTDFFISRNRSINSEGLIIYTQAAIHIAMKYEEIYPPELMQWTSKTKIKEIVEAEAQILRNIDFKLGYYSLAHFIELYTSQMSLTSYQKELINYLCDLSSFDVSMYRFRPSLLAISIIDSVILPGKGDQKMELNIKWMIERNQQIAAWLKEFQYPKLSLN